MAVDTMTRLTEAARVRLLADGYAKLSTRRVADEAGVPLSQIHYHFGGRQGLLLAVLESENQRRLDRQRSMYAADVPLSQRYDQACDFLEEDIESGYVRVLQEMIAAGWSDPAVADKVTEMLGGWFDLLAAVVRDADGELASLGPVSADEIAVLAGSAFLGGEALLLLNDERWAVLVPRSLRRVGDLLRAAEDAGSSPRTSD
jgi:AcrR family transcriptional regulator